MESGYCAPILVTLSSSAAFEAVQVLLPYEICCCCKISCQKWPSWDARTVSKNLLGALTPRLVGAVLDANPLGLRLGCALPSWPEGCAVGKGCDKEGPSGYSLLPLVLTIQWAYPRIFARDNNKITKMFVTLLGNCEVCLAALAPMSYSALFWACHRVLFPKMLLWSCRNSSTFGVLVCFPVWDANWFLSSQTLQFAFSWLCSDFGIIPQGRKCQVSRVFHSLELQ